MTDSISRLRAAANGQHGAFHVDQAHGLGIPDRVLRGWVSSGLLDKIGAHSLRSGLHPHGAFGHLAALIGDIRPEAWVSHDSAAALHGYDGFTLDPPFDVTLRRGSHVSRPDLRVHTSSLLDAGDRVRIDGLWVTSPQMTIIDVCPAMSKKRLTTVIDDALRDGLITEDRLLTRIAKIRTQGRYGIPKLLAVIEGVEPSRGGHSWLERKYLEVTAAAGYPRPITQAVVGSAGGRLIRVDCRYPGTNLVVELLGYKWHRTRRQSSRDAERLLRMVLDGLLPIQFTYDYLATDVPYVLASLAEAFRVCVKNS